MPETESTQPAEMLSRLLAKDETLPWVHVDGAQVLSADDGMQIADCFAIDPASEFTAELIATGINALADLLETAERHRVLVADLRTFRDAHDNQNWRGWNIPQQIDRLLDAATSPATDFEVTR